MAYHDTVTLENIILDCLKSNIPFKDLEVRVYEDPIDLGVRAELVISSAYFESKGLQGTRYRYIVDQLLDPVIKAVENSSYVRELKSKHEKEIAELKEDNNMLMEALTGIDTVLTSDE